MPAWVGWFAVGAVAVASGLLLYGVFHVAGGGSVATHQVVLCVLAPLVSVGGAIWSENRQRKRRERDSAMPSDHLEFFLWRSEAPLRRPRLSGTALGVGLFVGLYLAAWIFVVWLTYQGQYGFATAVVTAQIYHASRVLRSWLARSNAR